jgi:alpha-galactosidase
MEIMGGDITYRIKGEILKNKFNVGEEFSNQYIKILSSTRIIGKGMILKLKVIPMIEVEIIDIYVDAEVDVKNVSKIYLNGYQTWTESREFSIDEKINRLNFLAYPIMGQYGDYSFYKEKQVYLHGWTYTYTKDIEENYMLIGSLSEEYGYTLFHYDPKSSILRIKKDCKGLNISTSYDAFDLFFTRGKEQQVFKEYFGNMKIDYPKVDLCTGWTSWYNYYTKITQDIILENLEAFSDRKIPINIFQIDDGYQRAVGDWLCINEKFPKGMKYIADRIKKSGYKSGIWLAPFVCEKISNIFKNHKEWIARDENGRLIPAGFNPGWSGRFYVLDIYNEEFRQYLKEVFNVVINQWGYDMVKLDFLYAAALIKRKDKTRGQIMCEAVRFLRELVGDKIILGCGVPLGACFGVFDYCRIGSDVALKWEDNILKSINYRERVSTINSLISTIGRRHLNGNAFYNDPDVFILRNENNKLNFEQRYTLFMINLIFGGLVFTSDNINNYSHEELDLYLSIFPIKKKKIDKVNFSNVYEIYFKIQNREYLAFCNLNSKTKHVKFREGYYFSSKYGFIKGGEDITLFPYMSVCVCKVEENKINLVGSNALFPCSDISMFKVIEDNIVLKMEEDAVGKRKIFINIPKYLEGYKINGNYIKSMEKGELNIIEVNMGEDEYGES